MCDCVCVCVNTGDIFSDISRPLLVDVGCAKVFVFVCVFVCLCVCVRARARACVRA